MGKPDQELTEAKRLERVLMLQRWLYVPAVLLAAFLYDWLYPPAVVAVIGLLVLTNFASQYFCRRDLSHQRQLLVSFGLLTADVVAAFIMIIIGVRHGHTAIYIVFAPMIVEAAIRFELKGALIADVVFALVFLGIRQYGLVVWAVPYSLADYILIVGVMSFISLMVGMVVRERRRYRLHAEKLAAEHASLLERRRISNELHDSVLKSLEGLALEAHALRQQQGPEAVSFTGEQTKYVENVCRQISRDIRDVIFEMRAETTHQNIVERLSAVVNKWQCDNEAELIFSHSDHVVELPWQITHNLQKTVEEALTNVRRHTKASRVKLTLEAENHLLRIIIQDNGCGFNADLQDIYAFARKGRLGLVTMKERIEMAGGDLRIESNSTGTIITAQLPIPHNPEGPEP